MEGTVCQQVSQTLAARQQMVDQHRLWTASTAKKVTRALDISTDVTVKTMKIKFVTKILLLRAWMNGKLNFQAFRINLKTTPHFKDPRKIKLRLSRTKMRWEYPRDRTRKSDFQLGCHKLTLQVSTFSRQVLAPLQLALSHSHQVTAPKNSLLESVQDLMNFFPSSKRDTVPLLSQRKKFGRKKLRSAVNAPFPIFRLVVMSTVNLPSNKWESLLHSLQRKHLVYFRVNQIPHLHPKFRTRATPITLAPKWTQFQRTSIHSSRRWQ